MLIDSAKACLKNVDRLLYEAQLLEYKEVPATRYFLSIIAQEESAKGFLLYLVHINCIPWSPLTLRAARDHKCKQLLGIIIDFLNPNWDEYEKLRAEGRILEFPKKVLTAMQLLRYEKIGRWESNTWFWEEQPDYEKTALEIAEGKTDREKQKSLYVELSKIGEVAATPDEISKTQADSEYEKADRFQSFLKGLITDNNPDQYHYEKVKDGFRILFSQSAEGKP